MDAGGMDQSGRAELRTAGYALGYRLAEGGMGEIWTATRIGAARAVKPCAIKMLRPELAHEVRHRRRFATEGRIAMMLGHTNIVSVFDVGHVHQQLFMAMEWVDGVDLGEFRRRIQADAEGRPLAVDEAVHIVGALLDALDHVHSHRCAGHGIIHRDISPRNVMVSARGEIKLLDFGLARIEPELHEGTGPRFHGTLRYVSREQARGRAEAASDLFAVGAILHELLDGRKFRADCVDDDALITSIFEGGIPTLERPIPPMVEDLRRGLLEPRPELRIKSARHALVRVAAWPGYRNCRLRLEERFRRAIGEPRVGRPHARRNDPGHGIFAPSEGRRSPRSRHSTPLRPRSVEHAAMHRVAAWVARPERSPDDAADPHEDPAVRVQPSSGVNDADLERQDTAPWPTPAPAAPGAPAVPRSKSSASLWAIEWRVPSSSGSHWPRFVPALKGEPSATTVMTTIAPFAPDPARPAIGPGFPWLGRASLWGRIVLLVMLAATLGGLSFMVFMRATDGEPRVRGTSEPVMRAPP